MADIFKASLDERDYNEQANKTIVFYNVEETKDVNGNVDPTGVGGSRSKKRDRKSELVLRSTYQIFEWDRINSDRNFNVVRYVHIPLVP